MCMEECTEKARPGFPILHSQDGNVAQSSQVRSVLCNRAPTETNGSFAADFNRNRRGSLMYVYLFVPVDQLYLMNEAEGWQQSGKDCDWQLCNVQI